MPDLVHPAVEGDHLPTPESTDVLVDVETRAARERARLVRRSGRGGSSGALLGVAVGFPRRAAAQVTDRVSAYQPVVWTLFVVLLVAFYFPGRTSAPFFDRPEARAAAPIAREDPTLAAPVLDDVDLGLGPEPPVFFPGEPIPAGELDPPGDARSDDPVSVTVASVRRAGWASTTGGELSLPTPIPPGAYPVANRLGAVDKATFVSLGDTGTHLVLEEDPTGANELLGPGAVRGARWRLPRARSAPVTGWPTPRRGATSVRPAPRSMVAGPST